MELLPLFLDFFFFFVTPPCWELFRHWIFILRRSRENFKRIEKFQFDTNCPKSVTSRNVQHFMAPGSNINVYAVVLFAGCEAARIRLFCQGKLRNLTQTVVKIWHNIKEKKRNAHICECLCTYHTFMSRFKYINISML